MTSPRVHLGEYTATEFTQALKDGKFQLGLLPIGSVEDHYEHCPLDHDIRSSVCVSEAIAQRLFPQAIVLPALPAGLAEWKMDVPGTIRLRLSTMLSYIYDVVESLVPHGLERFLAINGHLGNHTILEYGGSQVVRRYKAVWRASTYWDVLTEEDVKQHLVTGRMPGHATEFETACALAWFPQLVQKQDMVNQEALAATPETGRALAEIIVDRNTAIAEEVLAETP
ncbi:MAG: creatininase family protein [Lentisphaerae bacterium]|nr:creatininase family protein [Lentisphaerota bacterium]MBT4814545.1 creatininase family protein [Lentisphaerota bacterium]MBT5608539.1 creatininase family protein [Lentisphaerota bacterium]MBT7060252.1 creatininase family protein [Lentisphaerota bacterium]MBT7843256.1 creatininase family protein [Lentisphaerota bacterium]